KADSARRPCASDPGVQRVRDCFAATRLRATIRPAKCERGRSANFNNLMKQAQAMQANMQKVQEEIATLEVIGEAGGGMVKVTMSGRHETRRVQIEPAVIGEDREMLEDLVAAAVNDAVHKVEAKVQEKMSSMTAGLQLPPGMKLPF